METIARKDTEGRLVIITQDTRFVRLQGSEKVTGGTEIRPPRPAEEITNESADQ